MRALTIIESAYRATLEEQDDTIVWLVHAMRGAGADLTVLLRGEAVNYAVKGQDASGLAFGDECQTQPPRLDDDIAALPAKGVPVYAVAEDLARLGVRDDELVAGVETVPAARVAGLVAEHDHAWHW